MAAGLVLAVLPTHGEGIVDFVPPGTEISGEVNCGTVFTNWSSSDGCEGPILIRQGATAMAFVVAVVFTGAGLMLLAVQARRER